MTWDLPGGRGGLQGGGGLVRCRGGRRFLPGAGAGGVGAKVGQRQDGGPDVVDSQQDLQGVDLLEALIRQGLTRPLDLLYAWGERAHPPPCRERRGKTIMTSQILIIILYI